MTHPEFLTSWRPTRVLAVAVTTLLLAAPEPSAAPAAQVAPPGSNLVYGIGDTSCGAWTKQQADKNNTYYEWWLYGFMSGASRGTGLQKTDSEGIAAWMNKYCAEHPLDTIVVGAYKLVVELTPRGRARLPQ
jgi:hypothetical protein